MICKDLNLFGGLGDHLRQFDRHTSLGPEKNGFSLQLRHSKTTHPKRSCPKTPFEEPRFRYSIGNADERTPC